MGAIFGVTEMVGWSGFEGAPCSLDRVALLHLPVLPVIFIGFANRRLLGNVDDTYIYIYTILFLRFVPCGNILQIRIMRVCCFFFVFLVTTFAHGKTETSKLERLV